MEPLSDLLSLLKPQNYASGGVALLENMAIRWPEHAGIKCYAVVSGNCWLTVSGISQPIRLEAGDCYLLPPGPSFSLTTDLNASPVDFYTLRQQGKLGPDVLPGEQESCFLVGGHFVLSGEAADLLLSSLPPVVCIQQPEGKAAMRWSLERIADEVRHPQPGSALITRQLAYMMLIQALRLHLANRPSVGWLYALADKQLNTALSCMHKDPAFSWTLELLAERAGMSRSAFAARFKEVTGTSAIDYLTRWRMMLACNLLKQTGQSLAQISAGLGYESESAFGKAFKRVIGCSPRQYAHGASNEGSDEHYQLA
ncbi:Bacillibactin transport regulator [Cedecea davisae]|uniref:Transcriptional regulator, AraC family n=1 Tax=Cedecea davisae DSM 4568 TaxID=566551 RepID=S3IWQ9_9ENTR|nr:AraC family transcriptional regulator [Cedecea davisae]EPF17400.1 transcriptional regulator, AraC family [Cedecea davisae DSM 4568]SUX27771.1 Bacillibactin transport regulator [Cedecea davisae]